MSAAGSGAIDAEEETSKKRRRDESFAVAGEAEADDLVIISYMGLIVLFE